MPSFRGKRVNRTNGYGAGRGDDPHGATQGYTFHGAYPQGMNWGSAQSGSSLEDVSANYANNNTKKVGDWAVGAIQSGGRYYPTAMTASEYDDFGTIDKSMQVGNLGFKSARKARKASVKAIKQSGGLPNSQNPNNPKAAKGIVHDSTEYDPFK
jgi:hypothetical protein